MKRTLTFLLLFVKRLCRKPSFLIILLLMPALVLGLRLVLSEDDETMHVALYNEGSDEKIEIVIDRLVESEGSIDYYRAESLYNVRADVLTEHAECGFVFREGLWQAMVDEEAEGAITLYQGSKSSSTDLIKETVFGTIYTELSYDILTNYLDEQTVHDGMTDEERNAYLREKYEGYVNDGGVFTISYMDGGETIEKDVTDVSSDKSYLMKPVRGTLSLFMFMAAMAGAVFWAIDEKDGAYKTLGYKERPFVNMVVIFIPALMSGLVALISIYIGGIGGNFFPELFRILAYCVILTGFANLIRSITSSSTMICSLLPMLTVVSLICCNIILNIENMVPGISVVRMFLPPNYYLETAESGGGCVITVAVGLALILAGVIIDRKKN